MTVYTDLAGRIRKASDQASELLGIVPARLAGNPKLPLFFVENRHRVLEMMSAAAAGGTMQMPTTLQGLNGRRRRVIVTVHRIGSAHQDLLEWELLPLDPNTLIHNVD